MEESIDILIIVYLNGEATSEQQEQLLHWLEKSEENKCYFRSMKDVYDLGHIESDIQRSELKMQWAKFLDSILPVRQTKRRQFPVYYLLRYVAVFIIGLVCMQVYWQLTDRKEEKNYLTKIETGVGERSKITLPDSSTVWVNSCSSISYDNTFGHKVRAVKMKGEAFFNVKKDKTHPFLVQTDKLTFRVTGTSFNVYSFEVDGEVSIALIEGAVTVEHNAGSENLCPGDLFIYDKSDGTVERKKIRNNSYTSWRYGEMFLENMTFEDLTRRLERSFNVKFKFENPVVKQESFNGSFRKYESLETILKVIETSIPVKFRIDKDTVYIK